MESPLEVTTARPDPKAVERNAIVAYLRVSTQRQGRSGLGIEAQRESVQAYATAQGRPVVAEYVEVETGKGSDALSRRPKLNEALNLAQRGGHTLVVARLDRLSRSVAFISHLMTTRIRFKVAEMPDAEELMLHIYAAFAEEERRKIASRTRDALKAAKARSVRLGNPTNLAVARAAAAEARRAQGQQSAELVRPHIEELRRSGVTTLRGLADALNTRQVPSPAAGAWHPASVQRMVKRIADLPLTDAR
jgi:DNA invertase Pin-like site-specific DNA recombinase